MTPTTTLKVKMDMDFTPMIRSLRAAADLLEQRQAEIEDGRFLDTDAQESQE